LKTLRIAVRNSKDFFNQLFWAKIISTAEVAVRAMNED
jgi:hypothetical protein